MLTFVEMSVLMEATFADFLKNRKPAAAATPADSKPATHVAAAAPATAAAAAAPKPAEAGSPAFIQTQKPKPVLGKTSVTDEEDAPEGEADIQPQGSDIYGFIGDEAIYQLKNGRWQNVDTKKFLRNPPDVFIKAAGGKPAPKPATPPAAAAAAAKPATPPAAAATDIKMPPEPKEGEHQGTGPNGTFKIVGNEIYSWDYATGEWLPPGQKPKLKLPPKETAAAAPKPATPPAAQSVTTPPAAAASSEEFDAPPKGHITGPLMWKREVSKKGEPISFEEIPTVLIGSTRYQYLNNRWYNVKNSKPVRDEDLPTELMRITRQYRDKNKNRPPQVNPKGKASILSAPGRDRQQSRKPGLDVGRGLDRKLQDKIRGVSMEPDTGPEVDTQFMDDLVAKAAKDKYGWEPGVTKGMYHALFGMPQGDRKWRKGFALPVGTYDKATLIKHLEQYSPTDPGMPEKFLDLLTTAPELKHPETGAPLVLKALDKGKYQVVAQPRNADPEGEAALSKERLPSGTRNPKITVAAPSATSKPKNLAELEIDYTNSLKQVVNNFFGDASKLPTETEWKDAGEKGIAYLDALEQAIEEAKAKGDDGTVGDLTNQHKVASAEVGQWEEIGQMQGWTN